MNYVVVIPANATKPISVVEVNESDLLHELQRLVGGYIELAPYVRGRLGLRNHEVIVNEEGKLHRLMQNFRATRYNFGRNVSDIIVGDAVVVRSVPDDVAGWDTLTGAQLLAEDITKAINSMEAMTSWTTLY